MANEAIKLLRALVEPLGTVGQGMHGGLPEHVADATPQAVEDAVYAIGNAVDKTWRDIPTGQKMYLATMLAVLIAFGFVQDFINQAEKFEEEEESNRNEVEDLLKSLGFDPDNNTEEE